MSAETFSMGGDTKNMSSCEAQRCLLLSNKQAVGVSLMKLLAVAISHNRTIDGVITGNDGGRMLSLAPTSIYPCCEQTFNLLVDGLFFDLEHQIYESHDMIVLTTPEFLSQGMQETLVERLQKWVCWISWDERDILRIQRKGT